MVGAVIGGFLGLGLGLVAMGCGGSVPTCPSGYVSNPEREAQIGQVLQNVPEYKGAVEKYGRSPVFCFGKSPHAGVMKNGTLLLPTNQDVSRSAARAAHLTLHLTDGLAELIDSPGDCGLTVQKSVEKEAKALLVELRVLDETKPPPDPNAALELEDIYHATPANRREGAVAQYLVDHPHGAPGLDGLVVAYTKRCRAALQSTSTSGE